MENNIGFIAHNENVNGSDVTVIEPMQSHIKPEPSKLAQAVPIEESLLTLKTQLGDVLDILMDMLKREQNTSDLMLLMGQRIQELERKVALNSKQPINHDLHTID